MKLLGSSSLLITQTDPLNKRAIDLVILIMFPYSVRIELIDWLKYDFDPMKVKFSKTHTEVTVDKNGRM